MAEKEMSICTSDAGQKGHFTTQVEGKGIIIDCGSEEIFVTNCHFLENVLAKNGAACHQV